MLAIQNPKASGTNVIQLGQIVDESYLSGMSLNVTGNNGYSLVFNNGITFNTGVNTSLMINAASANVTFGSTSTSVVNLANTTFGTCLYLASAAALTTEFPPITSSTAALSGAEC